MSDRELMQQALEALVADDSKLWPRHKRTEAIAALRKRLAQPEQEPVAWADMDVRGEDKGLSWTPGHFHKTPLYTTTPQRKPLPPQSPCEMTQAEGKMFKLGWLECEAAHGIKGEA